MIDDDDDDVEAAILPFDPDDNPPDIDDDTPAEERALAAAHAHYLSVRQALDAIDTSAYQARCAAVSTELIETIELQAYADHEQEAIGTEDDEDEDEDELTAEIVGYTEPVE